MTKDIPLRSQHRYTTIHTECPPPIPLDIVNTCAGQTSQKQGLVCHKKLGLGHMANSHTAINTIQYNTINNWYSAEYLSFRYKSKPYNITSIYVFINKDLFNLILMTEREGAVCMVTDKKLYSTGAAFWNGISPAYFSDVRGIYNRCWSLHLNCLGIIFWDRNWVRYNGLRHIMNNLIHQAQHLELNPLLYG